MAKSDASKYFLLTGRTKRHLSLVGLGFLFFVFFCCCFYGFFFFFLVLGIGKRNRSTGFVLQLEPLLQSGQLNN